MKYFRINSFWKFQEILKDLQNSFFNPSNSNQRVALENNVLRQRCQSILEDFLTSEDVTEAAMQTIFQVSSKYLSLYCCNYHFKILRLLIISQNAEHFLF